MFSYFKIFCPSLFCNKYIFFYWLYTHTQLKSLQGSLKFSKKHYTKCKQSILEMTLVLFIYSLWFFQMYHFSSILNKNFRISHSNTFVKILSILLRIDLFYLNKTADKAVLFQFTHKCIWSIQLCSIIENLLRWELSFESQCMST